MIELELDAIHVLMHLIKEHGGSQCKRGKRRNGYCHSSFSPCIAQGKQPYQNERCKDEQAHGIARPPRKPIVPEICR